MPLSGEERGIVKVVVGGLNNQVNLEETSYEDKVVAVDISGLSNGSYEVEIQLASFDADTEGYMKNVSAEVSRSV